MFRYTGLTLRAGGLVVGVCLNGSATAAIVVGTGGGGASATWHEGIVKGFPFEAAVVYAFRVVEVGEPTEAVENARERDRAE